MLSLCYTASYPTVPALEANICINAVDKLLQRYDYSLCLVLPVCTTATSITTLTFTDDTAALAVTTPQLKLQLQAVPCAAALCYSLLMLLMQTSAMAPFHLYLLR